METNNENVIAVRNNVDRITIQVTAHNHETAVEGHQVKVIDDEVHQLSETSQKLLNANKIWSKNFRIISNNFALIRRKGTYSNWLQLSSAPK